MTDELTNAMSLAITDTLGSHTGAPAIEGLTPHGVNALARLFLSHLADNLPDAMVEAGARAHCDHFGGEGWYSSGQAADSTEAMNAAMRLALTAALNVKEG